ncbi:MAG: hypothetical protein IV097_04635 [Burkholderiaceae bacterium]|nr:hypothetical protein [Burkholderiaceae bacterium]
MAPKKSRQLARLRDLCALELPTPLLMPSILAELHALVPSSRNLFDWCDDLGRLTQYYIEGPVDLRIAQLYFAEFHNRREREAMPGFAQAVRGPALIHGAAELNTPRFFNSALYAEIWRPQGFRYRVEAIVRGARQRPLGSLVLYRAPGERCFTPAEEAVLPQVLPYLAQALQRDAAVRSSRPDQWVPAPEPAQTLLLEPSGTIRLASDGAPRLLKLADAGLHVQGAGPAVELTLQALCAEAQTIGQARRELHSPWGRFEFSAQRLHAVDPQAQRSVTPSWIQVQLRRQEPRELADERRLAALELSSGQAAVCRLLLQGHAGPEVARRLAVAPSTVVDHTRKLYQRLGVRSVRELVERVRAG